MVKIYIQKREPQTSRMKEKSHGYIFEKIIYGKNVNFSKKQLADDLGLPPSTFYKFLKKEKFSKQELALIYLLYDIPPSAFGEKNNIFIPSSPELKKSNHENSIIVINPTVNKKNEQDYQLAIESYYNKVLQVLGTAQTDIKVLDYFGQRQPIEKEDDENEDTKTYNKATKTYYNNIIELFSSKIEQDKDFNYVRLLQLPFDYLGVLKLDEKEIDSICRFAISIMSVEKFEHVITCLQKFPDNFQVRIMSSPARPYTYILIDHNALVTEYFRYNIRKEAIPNILFANYDIGNKDMLSLIEQLVNEFNFHTKKNKDSITTTNINLSLFKSCFYDVHKIQEELVGDIKNVQELGTPEKIKEEYDKGARVEGSTIHKAYYTLSRDYALRNLEREEYVLNMLEKKKKILENLKTIQT